MGYLLVSLQAADILQNLKAYEGGQLGYHIYVQLRMQDRKHFYRDRISELTSASLALGTTGDRIVRLRLLVAVLIVGTFYLAFAYSLYFLWLASILVIVFFRLVQRHIGNAEEQKIVEAMRTLSSDELRLLEGDHSVFDAASVPGISDHIYATDLDVFGRGSLFQDINRTVTHDGRSRLIDMLLHPLSDISVIAQRREAATELTDSVPWRQRFSAIGSRSGETSGDMTDVGIWLSQPGFFQSRRYWLWIAGVAGLVSVSSIVYMLIASKLYLGVLIVILVVNTSVFQLFNKDGRIYFNRFGSRTALFRKFAEMFKMVMGREFRSTLGIELKGQVTHAGPAFIKLSRLHNLAEQRANGLVSFIMNGLFLFDVWTVYRIEKWRDEHKGNALSWIKALGHIDLLNSCANFRFNHPSFGEAGVVASAPFIEAEAMGHPLIPPGTGVVNDYQVGNGAKAHIITGSNMAGKSTFIRAVGLNVVLALNGLPVCARRFSCAVMDIASCIRITDSLEDHASYFKAELDRLQTVVGLLRSGRPYLVLLDEILRGTNSDDKRRGTLSFYRKLGEFNCVCLLATHDLAIGQLEEERPDRFANFCFESRLEGTELVFDYKLKKGVSSSTNATFLMKKLNLID